MTITDQRPPALPVATAGEAAEILIAVARSKHTRLELPVIAANHNLQLHELQAFLNRNGYPHPDRLIASARRITGGDTTETAAEPDVGPEASAAAAQPPAPQPTTSGPYVTALPASAMFVDETYQRELDERRVARMAKDYDPALVGILEVSARPGGRYAILDGQHRWALVKDVHFTSDSTATEPHLACRVHTGLTNDEEAALYHRLNTTRKQLTGWDRWKARRSSGDPVVETIERIAAAAGFTISYRSTRGHITATKACENVYTLGGPNLLDQVLTTIRTAYRDDPDAVTVGIIQGLGHILTAYPDDLDRDRLVEALTGIVPRQLNARAAAVREIHKGTIDKLTGHVIVEQYNGVRRAGQIAPFFDRVKPLSPNKGTKRAAEVERAAAIAKWALEQGLVASERSHITKDIRDQYDASHPNHNQEN